MSYQSFPWQPGNSSSFKKLLALYLPSLAGRSVLDAGCNTGYFCGWAAFQGASFVRGIDREPRFIRQAKEWFPECSFAVMSWDKLAPGERYDCILCLSAIHYADDQEQLIGLLMRHLAPGGLLVLEMGVAPGADAVMVPVARDISPGVQDVRFFPTWKKLYEMFAPYVYKDIGLSVPQAGDPVPRRVFHLQHARPRAILFTDGHYSGKSSTIEAVISRDIRRISGDDTLYRIASGKLDAPDSLRACVPYEHDSTAVNCAMSMERICANGCLETLADIWLAQANGRDFVLDCYVPPASREHLAAYWNARGFFVVTVSLHAAHERPWTAQRPDFAEYKAYETMLERRYAIDEEAYLAANPDVAAAVAAGTVPNASFHYWNFGRREKRKLKP